MKAISEISVKRPVKVAQNHSLSSKGPGCRMSKHLIAVFLVIFMALIVAPLNASTGPGKLRGSSCHHKQFISYSVFLTKKKNIVNDKKQLKKSKLRKHSFPV